MYLDYLIKNPHIKRILCTDVSDVVFINNPFELMAHRGNYLYVGQDTNSDDSMADNGWFHGEARGCCAEQILPGFNDIKENSYLLNAGVIGGERLLMIDFLEKVNKYVRKTKGKNCNMPVVNYVTQCCFTHSFYMGYPLTNRFVNNNVKVYVMHKSNYKLDETTFNAQ